MNAVAQNTKAVPSTSTIIRRIREKEFRKSFFLKSAETIIIAKIVARRIKLGLTRKEMAEKVGINVSYYGKFERAEANMVMDKLLAIMFLLDLNAQSPTTRKLRPLKEPARTRNTAVYKY